MESIMYRVQDGEKIFNLTSLKQSKSWDEIHKMDELDVRGHETYETNQVYYLYKHGMSNSLHNKFFD